MPKFKKISVPAWIKDGKLYTDREGLARKIAESDDKLGLRLTVDHTPPPKTLSQIKTFHGTMIDQIQQHYVDSDGILIPKDKIKQELKEFFLERKQVVYSDGTPVMVKVPHPEKKGVFFETAMTRLPSLGELSVEEMDGFIAAVISHFWHERGLAIEIKSKN